MMYTVLHKHVKYSNVHYVMKATDKYVILDTLSVGTERQLHTSSILYPSCELKTFNMLKQSLLIGV